MRKSKNEIKISFFFCAMSNSKLLFMITYRNRRMVMRLLIRSTLVITAWEITKCIIKSTQ